MASIFIFVLLPSKFTVYFVVFALNFGDIVPSLTLNEDKAFSFERVSSFGFSVVVVCVVGCGFDALSLTVTVTVFEKLISFVFPE